MATDTKSQKQHQHQPPAPPPPQARSSSAEEDKAPPDEEYLLRNGWTKDQLGGWNDPRADGKTEKVVVGELKRKDGGTEPLVQSVGSVGNWRWRAEDAVTIQKSRDEDARKQRALESAKE